MKSFIEDGIGDPSQKVASANKKGALTALVVESDKRFLIKLSKMIQSSQVLEDAKAICLETVPAQSLNEALRMLQMRSFDVILTDINLSDASGFLVLEQLLLHGNDAPIVILSNITNWSILLQAAQAGVSDFLIKKTLEAGILMRSVFYAIERKKLENKVNVTEALYRSLVEILPMGLVRVDEDCVVTYANDIASKMANLELEQMLGQKIEACFDRAVFAKAHQGIRQILNHGNIFETDLTLIHSSGERHIHFLATPIRGLHSSVTGAQCVMVDVTAQKQTQHEMEAAKSLDILQSGVSHLAHALNNALTPLLLDAVNLKSKLGTLLPDDPVQRIEHSVKKVRSVLRPFLFSTHGVGPRSEVLDFGSILNAAVQQLKGKLPPNIRVVCDGFDLSCSVSGDASMLSCMLTHLFENASESMSKAGSIIITLQAETLDITDPYLESLDLAPGGYLRLTVVDQGEGIESDQLQRVFEPFQTTKLPPHTGVGLTETLVIIRGHKGNIRLESEVGVGTKVDIFLPLLQKESKSSYSSDLLLAPVCSSDRKTILLVDDEENILESVQMLIEHMGHRVITASNGAEGLRLFKQQTEPVDLVITDYEMPLVNGSKLIQHLRELAPNIKIILFTGLESKDRVEELNKLEVDRILYKPFTPDSLKNEIGQLT